ncbi:hypothetical protein JYU34_017262 [Plutella xylostella]|uniref:Uncharacterized protein n=1 Tax=Plutella xylostella TaxID=51655 RepID=A0ABQ7PY66_PLUXY|nr:hypothetical protein JYU34_018677 [Plutella xylostella]KAG7298127.1 hypothetical protein JYU34_018896 [Plutella xylostella]KAG7298821.1 hypothetical protein JYU34_017262 [Plutella xylostella]
MQVTNFRNKMINLVFGYFKFLPFKSLRSLCVTQSCTSVISVVNIVFRQSVQGIFLISWRDTNPAVKAEERTFCVSSRACCSSDGDGDARGSREGPATGKLAGAPWTSNINPLLKIASPISSSQLEFGECGPRTSVTNRDLKEQMNE